MEVAHFAPGSVKTPRRGDAEASPDIKENVNSDKYKTSSFSHLTYELLLGLNAATLTDASQRWLLLQVTQRFKQGCIGISG